MTLRESTRPKTAALEHGRRLRIRIIISAVERYDFGAAAGAKRTRR
jgi:hypothetical protein